jgi:hypothetical protein
MSDGLRSLHALPVALADLAVGGVLVRYVSVSMGAALGAVGTLVLLTVAYSAVRQSGRTGARERRTA